MVYTKYFKKKSGTICGFYIYHSFKNMGKVSNVYIGKESDPFDEIERICSLMAQGFYDCYKLSEKDIEKYLGCWK